MARNRQDPRAAARHTGDLWQRGYQYQTDQNFIIRFGPFHGLAYTVPAGQETQYLRTCVHGVIRKGVVYPAWATTASSETPALDRSYRPRNFYIDGGEVMVHPGWLSSNDHVNFTSFNGSLTETNFDTGKSATGVDVDFTAWGNDIYYVTGASGGSSVAKYDISGASTSDLAGSPTGGSFIFVLDNNLCVVYKSSNVWYMSWAADGDPMDWTGPGAGTNPIHMEIGDVVGHVHLNGDVFLIGRNGAVRVQSTGTLPVFRFSIEPTFPGAYSHGAVASASNRIYYVGRDLQPAVWENGSVQALGADAFVITNNAPLVSVVKELNAVVFSGYWGSSTRSRALFFDYTTGEAVAEWFLQSFRVGYVASSPSSTVPGVYIYSGDFGGGSDSGDYQRLDRETTGGGTADDPSITTHYVQLGHRVHIQRIELLWQPWIDDAASAPNPTVTLTYLQSGTSTAVTGTLQGTSTARRMTYDISVVADNFSLAISSGTWDYRLGLRGILVYCAVGADDDREILG